VPLLFESYDELDYVRDPHLSAIDAEPERPRLRGAELGDGGWVRFFTTRPARTIDDVRRMRTFTWAGNPQGEELWKQAGFPSRAARADGHPHQPPGRPDRRLPGAADCGSWPTSGSASPSTCSTSRFAPIVGATVCRGRSWERIDPSLRPVLLRESELVGTRMRDRIRSLDGEAITRCGIAGLQVVTSTPDLEQQWRDAARPSIRRFAADLIPAADFDEVLSLVRERRAGGARR
jgi:TRAP-type C4-dicarboxylate transport system substrate-binding protein